MPYASVQQMRFMHARHPEIAARWDAEVRGQKKRGKYHKPPRRVAKARLTAAERRRLPDSAFAIPSRRAYPINDPAHARNALARVNQKGTSGSPATIARKVHRKYPGIGKALVAKQFVAGNAVGKADNREVKAGLGTGILGLAALRGGGELEHRATLRRRSAKGLLNTVSNPTTAAAVGGRHAFTPAPPGAHAAPGVSAAERSTAVARATRRVKAVERVTAPQIKLARRVKVGGLGLAGLGTVAAIRGLSRRSSPPAFPEY
jgi:hypothetical protein